MPVSHVETYGYSNWSITRSGNNVSSSGTASKLSDLYPINKILGTITASATGGFGWCSANDSSYTERGDSLYCNLTVTIYLVAANNQKIGVASATGSASRAGYLQCYSVATTGSCSFDISAMTDEQKRLYEYVQIGYSCATSSPSAHVEQVGAFVNGGTSNPTGSASITIRDTINVDFDGTEMTDLYFDGDQMSGLEYDGNVIF